MDRTGSQSHASTPRSLASGWAWLALPFAAGAIVRSVGFLRQVVAGDEMHAVRTALSMPVRKILVTYLPTDHCIPLTAFYRLLMDLGLRLGEIHLRFPVLAFGLLAMLLIPWLVERELGRRPALACAWLVAFSPMLVLYSRIIRSYLPVVVLATGAVAAWGAWYRRPRRWLAVLYVALACASIYFHLYTTPFVLAPFGFYLVDRLARRDGDALPWWRVLLPTLAVVALTCGFLALAWPSLQPIIGAVGGRAQPMSRATLTGVLKMLAGTSQPWLLWTFWLSVLRGLWLLLRKRPGLAFYGLILVAAQVVGLVVLKSNASHQPNILGRYLLVVLPIILLWSAVGLATPWKWLPGRLGTVPSWVASWLLPVLLFAAGPLAHGDFFERSFANRAETVKLTFLPRRPVTAPVPPIYRELDAQRKGAIIEYPWHWMWRFGRTAIHYQREHGREVIVAPGDERLWDPRLNFRNMVPPLPSRALPTRAAYFALHLDPAGEAEALDTKRRPPGSAKERLALRRRRELEALGRGAEKMRPRLEEAWGPADFAQGGILIWDLARLRMSVDEHGKLPQAEKSKKIGT